MKNRILSTARIAGILYLIVAVCGGFAELVRTSVHDNGDAAATAQNILDSQFLFRLGFSSDIVAFSAEVALAFVFYALLKPVNDGLALLAAFFRLGQAVALAINLLNQFIPIMLLSAPEHFAALETDQVHALVLMFMEAQSYGYLIGLVFFGLSTAVLGYLVLKSGYFPKVLGLLLMVVVPLGYLLDSFTSFLIEDKPETMTLVLVTPAALIELAFIGWLLVKGADNLGQDSIAGAGAKVGAS